MTLLDKRAALAARFVWGAGLVGLALGSALLLPVTKLRADAPAQNATDGWNALRDQDLRLAAILYLLATANAARCDRQMPATGLVLQAIDQFPRRERAAIKVGFGFAAPLSVEAVVPGSPADRAGLAPNTGVTSIEGTSFGAPLASRHTTARRDAAEDLLASLPPDRLVRFDVITQGRAQEVKVIPIAACRARIELLTDRPDEAQADATTIQIGIGNLARFDNDGLVVLIAHELAHLVLHHRELLDTQRASGAAAIRATEDEADRLSVHLLASAGYDPELGPRFWRGSGRELDAGIFRDATHASPRRRAAMMEAEIAGMRSKGAVSSQPDSRTTRQPASR